MDASNVRKVVIYGDHFWEFYDKQNDRVKQKIDWTIKLVQELDRIPEKYFKHIVGTTLYEMRILAGTNIFRVFCFFDKGQLVVVLNGFQKKTQKTPKNEIKLALKLQAQYYNEKES